MSIQNENVPLFDGKPLLDATMKKKSGFVGAMLLALLAMSSFLAGRHSSLNTSQAAVLASDRGSPLLERIQVDYLYHYCPLEIVTCLITCGDHGMHPAHCEDLCGAGSGKTSSGEPVDPKCFDAFADTYNRDIGF
jgi:hypothetical protein